MDIFQLASKLYVSTQINRKVFNGLECNIVKYYVILSILLMMGTTAFAEPIVTESTSSSTVDSNIDSKTTVYSPPPTAVSPSISATNSDLCTVGVAGAVQTQILGISAGSTVRDMNCEKLKNAKTLYDMGMKVAAVSVMCQDKRVFDAMMQAGTPCPFDGMIGESAKAAWQENKDMQPGSNFKKEMSDADKKTLWGVGGLGSLLLLLLL
tara:strand:- start:1193 stop:1819 length:627 start_codon:yes stop_codon:yes gene_type:complete